MKFAMVSGLNESYSKAREIVVQFTGICEILAPLGYKGIELALLEPEKLPVKELQEIANSYQMEIPTLGTGSTFLRFRYSLGDLILNTRKKAIGRIRQYINFAAVTHSKIIIGLIRGRYKYKNNPDLARRNIITSLKHCSKLAENHNIDLLIEPINRFESDSCNTIADTLAMIDEIGAENVQLMIDTFHTHLEEDPDSIWPDLETFAPRVTHLHLADDTRRAPGTGHFDFKRFLRIFQRDGFHGFASVETIMKPSFTEVARQTMTFLQSIQMIL